MQWSRCLVADDEADPVHGIPLPVRGAEAPLPEDFGYATASEVTRRAIEAIAGTALLFHASGISDDAGRVVALVGPSGSGKTTASRALASDGWGYVTDETVAVVDDDGRVVPYPKPLSVVMDSTETGRKSQHGPDALGLGHPPNDLTLTRVVMLDRSQDSEVAVEVDWPTTLDAVLELVQQTSALARVPQALHRLCGLVARCGIARLTYSDARTLGPVLGGLLRAEVPPVEWGSLTVGRGDTDSGAAYSQAEVIDAVRIGDEGLLLLVDGTPVRLSPLGVTLWERCAAGASPEELLSAAVAKHGHHPEAGYLVSSMADEMVRAGVFRAHPHCGAHSPSSAWSPAGPTSPGIR